MADVRVRDVTLLAIGLVAGAGLAIGVLWADRWINGVVNDMDWGVEDGGDAADDDTLEQWTGP